MRINELRLYGFKSFANKTTIKFDDNFIGIVGPNGSGKSNIIDAIRWVFGEQSSKSLRGKSSVDVIFGGTQTRKKANFAEVTLVLDNSDQHVDLEYNEVSVTRRLYRSGDSEYLINNVECRMKDIVDLFMDSGIGRNSFSIISQGKIEEIIVSKPEARRQVIEDISGVLKYKKRKEAAIRKLDRTNENLKQVDLILGEMDQRLGPLEKQRDKAKEFNELKEKLEKYEVSYLANRIYDINDDFVAYKKINEEITQKIVKTNNDISIADATLAQIQDNELKVKNNISEITNQITQTQEHIYDLQANFKMISERQKMLDGSDSALKINNLKQSIFKNKELLQKNQSLVSERKNDLNKYEEEINNLNQEITTKRNRRYDVENELSDLEQQSKRNNYSFSVSKIIETNKFTTAKVVRDLFKVDYKYAEAINVCISGRLNDIIMDDMEEIKLAIKYLRDNKFGRATFMSLKDVKYRNLEDNLINDISKENGYIDIAYNLVEVESKYQDVFKNLLNTTVVFDNLDNATKAFKKYNQRVKIVTLDGDVLANNGSISGGKFKQVNPLLVAKKQEDLTNELDKLNSSLEELINKLKVKEESLHEIRLQINYYYEEAKNLEEQIRVDSFELKELDVDIDEGEVASIDKELEEHRARYNELHNKRLELENMLDKYNEERQEIILNMKNDNEELKLLSNQQNDNNIKISRMEMELDSLMTTLSEEYQLSFERAYQLADKNINIEEYKEIVSTTKRRIKSLGVINPDAINEYEEIKERYDFLSTQKEDLLHAMEKLTTIMDQLDTVVIEQFDYAYKKLREEFKYIFSELFGGGQADLVLTNPEDLLNTGVEIVAQPPGKKLQTISLLSGGEKALTAISLLFAILRIKKIPFTILDEVEAALDEVNVKRYANYIKVFSERTQFLVITHRQGTMEACDSLFGITMVEKGISSVFKTTLKDGVDLTKEG